MNALKFLRKLPLSDKHRLEWYPPFWLMGVKVIHMDPDWSRLNLKLPLTMWSKNMGDSMFGGYQASLSDPIAALACARRFPGVDVWSRHHAIDFRQVGNSDLELRFEFPAETHEQIQQDLAKKGRSNPTFEFGFYRQDGVCCSWITTTVAIRPEGYLKPR